MRNELYAVNTTTQTVEANGTIPFNTIVRRYGNAINLSGTNAILYKPSYYRVLVNITYTAGATGLQTFKLTANDTDVLGATASQTITTADTEVNTISFFADVRKFCYEQPITLKVITSGEIDITNAEILVFSE